jgi:hypothetical protein
MFSRLMRPLLLAASLVLASCAADGGTEAAGAGFASPQELLQELYGHYADKPAGSGVDLADSATMAKYFTPEMAARIDADARQAAAKDEPPALNGDPFVGAQDWQVSELAIAVAKSTEPDRTMAVIAFKNYGAPTEVKLSLARSAMGAGTGWQIADIDWGYDKLSNILPE